MINLPRILAGLVLSTLIGWLAYQRRSLTRSGWLGAIVTGTLTFGFGGWSWGLGLIGFFVSSSLLSHYKQQRKQQLAGEKFEKGGQRDFAQAMANGGLGALLALIYGITGEPGAILAMFAGVLASVTADTWGTELGVLNRGMPRLITNFRPVPPGTSGGVSGVGAFAGAIGALFIGMLLVASERLEHGTWPIWLLPVALFAGVAGSLIDSLLGATLQAMYHDTTGHETERAFGKNRQSHQLVRGLPWLHNDAVNVLSSAAGALLAFVIYTIIR